MPLITTESNRVPSVVKKTSRIFQGFAWERRASLVWHKRGIPLLVSPKLLRALGCGQIDIGVIVSDNVGKKICLVECKSEEGISEVQYRRLKKSAWFLSALFNLPVSIEVFVKREKI